MATNARPVGEWTLTIAAEIRARRKGRGMLAETLCALANIPGSTLSQIENGKAAIDMEQLYRIARAFDTTPEELISTAREHAGLYRPDGTLNPDQVRFVRESDKHVDALLARDDLTDDGTGDRI